MKKSSDVKLGSLNNDQLDAAPANNGKKAANNSGKNNDGKKNGANGKKPAGQAIKKFFRDLISELKKVSWGKMKSTPKNKGVLSQTGIVLLFVLIAIIILTCMDLGLTALLNLLIGIAG